MLGAEGPFVDGDGTVIERLGFGIAAGGPVEFGKVVEARVLSEWSGGNAVSQIDKARSLSNSTSAVAASLPVDPGEIVEALGDIGVVRRQRLLADLPGAQESNSASANRPVVR